MGAPQAFLPGGGVAKAVTDVIKPRVDETPPVPSLNITDAQVEADKQDQDISEEARKKRLELARRRPGRSQAILTTRKPAKTGTSETITGLSV